MSPPKPIGEEPISWLRKEVQRYDIPTPLHILELRNHIYSLRYFSGDIEHLADSLYDAPTIDSALIYANRIHDLLTMATRQFNVVHNYLLQRYEAMYLRSSSSSPPSSSSQSSTGAVNLSE